MGRSPCCERKGLKKGPRSPEEDQILMDHISKNGHESWHALPKLAGLLRCGKSCWFRWTNYLRPDIKHGHFSLEEEKLVIRLQGILGNSWRAVLKHQYKKQKRQPQPVSQASSCAKCETNSIATTEIGAAYLGADADSTPNVHENDADGKCSEAEYEALATSESSGSSEFDSSTDTAIEMLFDFPINNDMSFLEGSA